MFCLFLSFLYIQAMHTELCSGKSGLCSAMDPIDGELLKNYLLKVNFTGIQSKIPSIHSCRVLILSPISLLNLDLYVLLIYMLLNLDVYVYMTCTDELEVLTRTE